MPRSTNCEEDRRSPKTLTLQPDWGLGPRSKLGSIGRGEHELIGSKLNLGLRGEIKMKSGGNSSRSKKEAATNEKGQSRVRRFFC